ncbi:MAG: ABC transporter transmembrane domain-containing protein [Bacteroidota bacterium]
MTEQKKTKISKHGFRQVFTLYKYLKPYSLKFSLGLLFLLFSSGAMLFFPKMLGIMVDLGNRKKSLEEISHIGIILVILLLVQAFFGYFRTRIFVEVTEKTLASIRQSIYNHIIKMPLSFFAKRRVGELNSRISSDISLLQDTLTSTLADFISQLIFVIGGIILMISSSPLLTLFMMSIVPAVALMAFFFGRSIRRFSKKAQNQVAESNTVVEETLQGIQNVKAFVNELFEMKRYRDITDEVARTGIQGGKYQAYTSFIVVGFFMAMGAVIWKGATLISTGKLAAGELFSFVIYSGFIAGNIAGMASVYTRLQRTMGAAENMLELLNEPTEDLDVNYKLQEEHRLFGEIEFQNIAFDYPSRKDFSVLSAISFNVNAGEQVALVGPSGAGKSTLVSLLMRFYEPVSGSLLFDGRDSQSFPLSAIRSQMAMVPQDVFLFGGTIRENIAYGKPDASEEEIIEAASQANAWDFIREFPEKLETIVGDRGVQLSGGQRQRIAIARAVLKDPKILILDEATSSLDSESERLVQEALVKLMQGRTSIVIAHRLSTIRSADKIIVINGGMIVEQGTHEELMKLQGGLYRGLSEMQFG